MEIAEEREVVFVMTLISLPCSKDTGEHDVCPDDTILDLWQLRLQCACECHTEYEWSG